MTPVELEISVVFCAPGVDDVTELRLPAGSTVAAAIEASGVIGRQPAASIEPGNVGIWGRLCGLQTLLADGDRVEIYRPLLLDPKDARRRRAEVRAKRRLRGA